MRSEMMKSLVCLLVVAFGGAIGCGQSPNSEPSHMTKAEANTRENANSEKAFPKTTGPVTLISRYNEGDYVTATYSFRHLTRDNVELTRNNWELIFEARADFEDYFGVNMVVDDNSFIYDLGNKRCADIYSASPERRKTRPLAWLARSEADPSELTPSRKAKVQTGHCYLTYNNDEDGRVIALFHVQSHEKSKTVTIDEIEVLDVLTRR